MAQVVAVGYDKCSTEGSHGAARHVSFVAFPTLPQAVAYIRTAVSQGGCGCSCLVGLLGGVGDETSGTNGGYCVHEQDGFVNVIIPSESGEISNNANGNCNNHAIDDSGRNNSDDDKYTSRVQGAGGFDGNTDPKVDPAGQPLHSKRSFSAHQRNFPSDGKNVCIVLNKNARGLAVNLAAVCDSFVHIPHTPVIFPTVPTTTATQTTSNGSNDKGAGSAAVALTPRPLIDTPAALSITLHHFCAWAKYNERAFQGHKFDVAVVRKGQATATFGQSGQQSQADGRQNAVKDIDIDEDPPIPAGMFGINATTGDEGDY